MADKIQPTSKPVGKANGMPMGSSHSTITTPDAAYGRYFGSDKSGSQAVNSESIMGKKK